MGLCIAMTRGEPSAGACRTQPGRSARPARSGLVGQDRHSGSSFSASSSSSHATTCGSRSSSSTPSRSCSVMTPTFRYESYVDRRLRRARFIASQSDVPISARRPLVLAAARELGGSRVALLDGVKRDGSDRQGLKAKCLQAACRDRSSRATPLDAGATERFSRSVASRRSDTFSASNELGAGPSARLG